MSAAGNAEQQIRQGRLVAIVRQPLLTARGAARLTEALVGAGVRALEFTLTSRGALDAVRAARQVAGDAAAVGTGTVLTVGDVERAADAGATFAVSPDVSEAVVRRTVELGLTSLPGAFTATEVRRAVDSGAHLVKLFPAQPAGPGYLGALLGPLPDVGFVPTGGVGVDDVPGFLSAGAVAVALGSQLVRADDDLEDDACLEALRHRASRAVEAATGRT